MTVTQLVGTQLGAVVGERELRASAGFDVIDPATGEPFAVVARCGAEEVDAAVRAARAAFDGGWRARPAIERARLLRALAELIRRDAEELAATESRDTGKPLRQARMDATLAARYFDFYADVVQALHGDVIPGALEGLTVLALREPHGVTGHIAAWNYPMQIAARTVAPALAAGNCCVLKPAEEAPLTALRFGHLALEAGLPPGALNVVPGIGEEAGAALAAHPGVDHLSFVGSTEVGALVAGAAARNCVPVTLELGGKSPNLLFADADLEQAIPAIVGAILQNGGQTCSAGSRLLVESSIHAEVVEQIRRRFERVSIGAGLTDPDLGPLISAAQHARLTGLVEQGRAQAALVTGGARPAGMPDGFFFEPTLFDGVAPDGVLGQEELFGPVLSVIPFETSAQALEIANGTPYGLVAGVWTRDLDRALWLSHELKVGQVFVNTYGAAGGVELPFGGRKGSGYGREKGFEGLLGYTQVKTVAIQGRQPVR